MEIENAHVLRFMEEQVPFNRLLGIRIVEMERGRVVMELPFRPELVGDPFRPALHGGAISTLIDTCGGAAVFSSAGPDSRISTVDLRVDFLRPGPLKKLRCEAVVARIGNRVGVVRMSVAAVEEPDRTIATGNGVYNIHRTTPRREGSPPDPA